MTHADDRISQVRGQIRRWILFFIVSILFFGVTAFPLEAELKLLDAFFAKMPGAYADWVHRVYKGLEHTNDQYPFLAYGTDWLAFAHIIIALLFIGPYRDPIRNSWVIDWGILSCLLAFPLAFIAGPLRQVPFFHQAVDAVISLAGLASLLFVRTRIRSLKALQETAS